MATRTELAEAKVVRTAEQLEADDAQAEKSRLAWEDACFAANTKADVSYERLAELSGKSRSRIDQVLRSVRKRMGLPINSSKS